MALALNSNYESAENQESEVESTRSGFSKLVQNVLEWGVGSATASAALNGLWFGVRHGVEAIIPGIITGGITGFGLGSIIGGAQSLWRGLRGRKK